MAAHRHTSTSADASGKPPHSTTTMMQAEMWSKRMICDVRPDTIRVHLVATTKLVFSVSSLFTVFAI